MPDGIVLAWIECDVDGIVRAPGQPPLYARVLAADVLLELEHRSSVHVEIDLADHVPVDDVAIVHNNPLDDFIVERHTIPYLEDGGRHTCLAQLFLARVARTRGAVRHEPAQ